MTVQTFQGIIAYPITPFRPADGAVDTGKLRALIDRLVDSGVHGVAPLGSAGESAYLSEAEWFEAAGTSLDAVAGRVPTLMGVSDLTTAGAVKRARFAKEAGADAVMVLPTSYWKLSEQEILRHYGTISEAVDIPVMAYNNPATSGIDMSPELLVRLVSELDNVTMVKESSGDVQRMHRLTQLTDGELPFFNGSNPLALEAFAAGATGWCTAAPCLFPGPLLALYDTVRRGDLENARRQFYRLLPLLQFILRGGLPTTIKAGLALQGLDVGEPRRPLLPLDEDGVQRLKSLLAAL
ncbi:dihydrodipicolinate synthase family protein [Streptomyces spectabilis]|uniref:Dihydrodipicolinate synthase family protein n=1 Tax=Streptomyces spectabilis TaxID=68270 RepID=A0A516R1M7_STRST|nr:dihydrodipicolinate synthase family protein [Streptomyces spectabilis]QDQ09552.1 dihydrodipicolinate synthase family protein [Streptomyces spectabilis]